MTHLYIELNTGLTEEVNSSIISKLYELAISGDLDETSDLKGRLHSTSAKDVHMNYLNTNFDDLYINADKVYMTFADPQVEQIILNQGWGDGVGVTTQDLGLITTFSGSVFKNSNITSFNEYRYFAKATTQSSAFYGCSSLTSIEYPPASTSVGSDAHINNTALTHVKIDNTLITSISNGMFSGCSSLQSITFPATCTSIGNYSFQKCYKLQSIVLPEGITTIGNQAFSACSEAFTVDIPSTVTNLGTSVFYNVGQSGNFSNITKVIFRSSNPPACTSTNDQLFGRGSGSQTSTLYIYVPDDSVNTYKAHSAFSYYADRIFGISQLPS